MKKLLLLITFIFFTSCISRNNEKYVLNEGIAIVKAEFFKIETKKGIHIYHFKNDSIEGVFVEPIVEDFTNPNFKEIKLNKKYTLVLSKQISYGHRKIENTYQTIIDNDFLIWQTGMKSKYFTGCENITGNKINPRFTMIKYINPKETKFIKK